MPINKKELTKEIALKNIAGGECYMRTSLDDMM